MLMSPPWVLPVPVPERSKTVRKIGLFTIDDIAMCRIEHEDRWSHQSFKASILMP
jgi:hypothetical protein